MGEQQRAGGAQGQLVRLLLPVVVEKKLAIDGGDFVIAGKGLFLQVNDAGLRSQICSPTRRRCSSVQ
jgi:hypothetical protein